MVFRDRYVYQLEGPSARGRVIGSGGQRLRDLRDLCDLYIMPSVDCTDKLQLVGSARSTFVALFVTQTGAYV